MDIQQELLPNKAVKEVEKLTSKIYTDLCYLIPERSNLEFTQSEFLPSVQKPLPEQDANLQYYHELRSVLLPPEKPLVVKLLMKLPEGSTCCTSEIVEANLLKFLKQWLLLAGTHSIKFYNRFFAWASDRGYPEVIRLLLRDPSVNPPIDNYVIRAAGSGRWEILRLLLADPRVVINHSLCSTLLSAIDWAIKIGRYSSSDPSLLNLKSLLVEIPARFQVKKITISESGDVFLKFSSEVEAKNFIEEHNISPVFTQPDEKGGVWVVRLQLSIYNKLQEELRLLPNIEDIAKEPSSFSFSSFFDEFQKEPGLSSNVIFPQDQELSTSSAELNDKDRKIIKEIR